jgi:16S rRNA (cytosine1402-N4)-methyltransferase
MVQLHTPVLLAEVLDSFSNLSAKKHLIYFDGTFGRGGHYKAIKEKYNLQTALATDQDHEAIEFAQKNFSEVKIQQTSFYEFAKTNSKKIDLALIDLGVSSPQLDQAERGFSFLRDGPLDMRMNRTNSITAEIIVNEWSEAQLIDVFKTYGEVEKPIRVIRAIINDRPTKKFTTTLQLAQLIERVDGWSKKGFHPATQYFMGLRLVINSELEFVEKGIPLLMEQLSDGGRLSVITFHSLEDRLVKTIFRDSKTGFPVYKKVIVPSDEECKTNSRARSAKLRVFQKGTMPEKPDKFALRRKQRDSQMD